MLPKPAIRLVATVVFATMLVSPLGAKTADRNSGTDDGVQIVDRLVIQGSESLSTGPKGEKLRSSGGYVDMAAKLPTVGKVKASGKPNPAEAIESLDPSCSLATSKPGTKPVDQRKTAA